MIFLPYLTVAGVATLAMGLVWLACVWLPKRIHSERADPLTGLESDESIDACATTGRFTRFDVDED